MLGPEGIDIYTEQGFLKGGGGGWGGGDG